MSIKSDILREFEKSKGQIISGSKLAKELNVSRTSVWKHIEDLRKEGYEINAVTNKGYSLSDKTDLLSAEGILSYLNEDYSDVKVSYYKELESTNKTAKELALKGEKHGTVIVSEKQTAGRGRMGRNFFSPGNTGIYMSIILKPELSVSDSVLITTAASVAVCRAIEKVTGINAKIKWINDIVLNNKKICGILTEASTDFESGTVSYIILGMGINFKTPEEGFPEDIKDKATSLFDESKCNISRNELCAEIIKQVLSIIDNLKSQTFIAEYKERSIVLNQNITFIRNGISTKGKAIDINDDGSLVVQKEDKKITILNSGEISIRGISYAK
ncbi:MAG: biotin--[acetyl-CoA-carboxylase] ligase [Clostridium sp.]|uniref:biotin--[acetyl-CoA-carboxylase] ligase n=1 Tax=Clostridium sp. DSM 8431 TaxID=1761781 RepID=UPI0008E927C6|nr:biotin--[acetyl-CoA-carboxylase] ligase [Clostridium sp. DSM 8431]MCR4943324.1 biotin--[acetyl-CoA-carboxylase] ligase [Clostridium sp.]SFU84912.1 BirA family transcriptional regulator, biotin operon repressor / biotin-[acetyl-CoA-carboxylase] ligase [Clostridium sp. DSM 8431]